MPVGLQVSRLVDVTVNIAPLSAQFANFDSLLIMGDSNVINTVERIRTYNSISEVAADFGTTAPEYLAAVIFFSQVPSPEQLYIGRWAQTATSGQLICGVLSTAQALISAWTGITTGAFKIAVDGGVLTGVSSLNFSAASNLNAVASIIQTAVRALAGAFAAVTVVWNGEQFVFTSGTTGAASAVAALAAPAAGVDISAQLKGTLSTLQLIVPGIAAETALASVVALDQIATQWYGLMFASTHIVDADILAIAAYIEADGQNLPHIYGVTTNESAALSSADSTSIGYQLKQLGYRRTFTQWSSSSPYACAGIFGKGCTVDFDGSMTVITFAWKQDVGVTPELLTATQADALKLNNYNFYAFYNNNTMTIMYGTLVNGDFIDNTWDLDWLANRIQTNVLNVLYTSLTKVPQTNAGNHMINTAIAKACDDGVNNGTIAPGQWNSGGFGQLKQGDFLSKGYYIYQPDISTQEQSDREARKSVAFQVAIKLAGAIHTVDVLVNVNR